jgi:hypothetical protein
MTDNNRPKERRLHARFTVKGVVELGAGAEGAAVLRDISMSGLSCVSPVAFDEMAILEISMLLPMEGEGLAFKAGGAVVRCQQDEPDQGGKYQVAVFFTPMDDANRQALETFITTAGEQGADS